MSSYAEVYKWVDKDGIVHYGDKPDINSKTQTIEIEPIDSSKYDEAIELQKRLLKQAEQADKRIQARNDSAAAGKNEKTDDETNEKRCLEARKQLSILQEQRAIYRDENGRFHVKWAHDTYKGKREYLDDEQRSIEIGFTNKIISLHYKNPQDVEEQKKARNKVIISEYCQARRSELAELLLPGKRVSRQEIEEKRKIVKKYCDE